MRAKGASPDREADPMATGWHTGSLETCLQLKVVAGGRLTPMKADSVSVRTKTYTWLSQGEGKGERGRKPQFWEYSKPRSPALIRKEET